MADKGRTSKKKSKAKEPCQICNKNEILHMVSLIKMICDTSKEHYFYDCCTECRNVIHGFIQQLRNNYKHGAARKKDNGASKEEKEKEDHQKT